ncbi:MAG TPA: chaperone NapD [Rhodocyclaceae bacterium]|nr:chaperone NapD [Rhodocyclaceae bacterium]HMV53222.1 chaperone NapD [Rhodocyclaceae bacterium]HNA02420.1 chaperone NapD [Rhodocyclaceae bacterium]HNB77469.1 chaperone NapD [Rhodocyclaceae bacterium]HNC60036.1 chaperone NapD [Rhodocyclaceae bacterium]
MELSSMILRTRPERIDRVRGQLLAIPGVEVHGDAGDGRLVVTVEDGDGYKLSDSITRLHDVDGVVAISLVYEYSDNGLETGEARQ